MKNRDTEPTDARALRQRAEQKLSEQERLLASRARPEAEARALLHELQVHQIELEMQNEELQRAQAEAREAADKYTELFDFAPVGYFVLDAQGVIQQVNLAGAALLGCVRSLVNGQPFAQYVEHESRHAFGEFCRAVEQSDETCACELRILKHGHAPCDVLVKGVNIAGHAGCRLAVTDITTHRRIEDALRFLNQSGYKVGGEDFFQSLARYLGQSLGMDFVCIDQLLPGSLAAKTVAIYFDGKFEDNVSYALKDTPCGDAAGQAICCFPKDVRHLFPKDAVLQKMQAESYVGTTLWSFDAQPIGLIAVIGRQPLADPLPARTLLQLVAVRAAAELQYRQAEDGLRVSNQELTRFNAAMVGRELRMIELKKEVNALCAELHQPPRYQRQA